MQCLRESSKEGSLFYATLAFGHPFKEGEAVVAMVDNYL